MNAKESTIQTYRQLNSQTRNKAFDMTKRLIDALLSSVLLVLTSPVFLVILFMFLFGNDKGPMFFRQFRYGKDGRQFEILKFRSMVMNADKKLKEDEVLYQRYIKNNYKLEPDEDPRITKLGRFLRKTSLDELPQLINVLKGEMSLVGPRPIVDEELEEYKDKQSLFLSVKPGVTGYWQVSGRSEVGYPERVDLELYYVINQSMKLDIIIMFKTFSTVFSKKGAY